MKAAVYARVSSSTQRDRHTIESQLRVLPDYARGRGWDLAGTYIDDGRSAKAGKLDARVGLSSMLRDAKVGKFDVVVIVDIDRLTRSEDLTERGAILGAFQKAGVKVAIATTGQLLDFSDSTGDLFGSLQAFFAAEWGRKHRSRIMEGKLTAISRGKKPAGPTPYGYRYNRETGVWSIHEAEAAIVREIFERLARGETGEDISRDLRERGITRPRGGVWLRERVYQVSKNPVYRGEWIADKVRKLSVPVPEIVTADLWNATNDRKASATRKLKGLRRTKHVYLLEGLAECMLCGARVGIASGVKRTGRGHVAPSRYVCGERRRPTKGAPCDLPYLDCTAIDERVWRAVREAIITPGRLERAARAAQEVAVEDADLWRKDLVAAERRMTRLTTNETAILARFRRGLISEAAFDVELAAFKLEREQAQRQIDAARTAQQSAGRRSTRAAGLEALVSRLRQRVDATTPEERRDLVRLLFGAGSVLMSGATVELTAQGTPQAFGLAESAG